MITVVAKPFSGPEGELPSGTVIDSSAWRNESRLINCRYLRPATESEAIALRAPDRGARAATPTGGGKKTQKAQKTQKAHR